MPSSSSLWGEPDLCSLWGCRNCPPCFLGVVDHCLTFRGPVTCSLGVLPTVGEISGNPTLRTLLIMKTYAINNAFLYLKYSRKSGGPSLQYAEIHRGQITDFTFMIKWCPYTVQSKHLFFFKQVVILVFQIAKQQFTHTIDGL